jgi:hypothetical protein
VWREMSASIMNANAWAITCVVIFFARVPARQSAGKSSDHNLSILSAQCEGSRVGLLVLRRPRVERRPNRFGTESGWRLGPDSGSSIAIRKLGHGLEVSIECAGGEGRDSVIINLDAGEASAFATRLSPTVLWLKPRLAGVVVATTDGESAAIDFEFYDAFDPCNGPAYFGQIWLDGQGDLLAPSKVQGRAAPTSGGITSNIERRALVARGQTDAFGRRQGLWEVLDNEGRLVLASCWRNGIPDGSYRFVAPNNEGVGNLTRGFTSGTSIEWRAKGVRVTTQWFGGLRHGERIVYSANGNVELYEMYNCNSLVAEGPSAMTLAGQSSYLQSEEFKGRAAFLDSLDGLHTRHTEWFY